MWYFPRKDSSVMFQVVLIASGLFRVNPLWALGCLLLQADSQCGTLICGALVNPGMHQGFSKGRACFIQLFAIKK